MVTADHYYEVIYGLSNSDIANNLECLWRSFLLLQTLLNAVSLTVALMSATKNDCFLWVVILIVVTELNAFAFSASSLLGGHQEEHPACKNEVMRCWRGYLSGMRCKWFAYGPADVTATYHLLVYWNQEWFVLSGAGLPRLYWKKEAVKRVSSADEIFTKD